MPPSDLSNAGVRALKRLVLWEAVKGIVIGAGLFGVARIVVPDLVNARDDGALALAVVVAVVFVLALVALGFDTWLGVRRLHRRYHLLERDQ